MKNGKERLDDHYKKVRQNALDLYYKDPKLCKECDSVILVKKGERPTQTRKRDFCDRSCATKFNNRNRVKGESLENREKEQLGMPHSTAQSRLKKKIMFSLIVETGKNICHRCGLPMTEDDFSIEHKEYWLDVSPDLFWDLNNISFSHLACNSKHSRNPNEKKGLEGTTRCWKCGKHLDNSLFPPCKFKEEKPQSQKNGVPCKSCKNEITQKWRKNSTAPSGRKKVE